MLCTIEVKLYLSKSQERTLSGWLRTACWTYNRALEHRIKAWKRRRESVTFNKQSALLTVWRSRVGDLASAPVEIERDALRRVDRGMRAFFRRCKTGEAPGFPRFRPHQRYNSMEFLDLAKYVIGSNVRIPKLGKVRARGIGRVVGEQRFLRVIRRASGWYAQVVCEDGIDAPVKRPIVNSVGIDVGLTTFAALSNGETFPAPRFAERSRKRVRGIQRRVSRRVKGSQGRRKAVDRLRRVYERIFSQRRNFAHQLGTDLVRRFDMIAVEDLNVKGLARSKLARSVNDAAWSIFTAQLERKAERAGVTVVRVDPRGTSQECPSCGRVAKKQLSERAHSCKSCGLVLDRDVAAARVILARALGGSREQSPVEESASVCADRSHGQVGPVKREALVAN